MASVVDAAASGSTRDLLLAMRDRIAIAVEDKATPARDLAALTRRLMDIAKELEALDAADAEDDIGRALDTEDEDFDPTSV